MTPLVRARRVLVADDEPEARRLLQRGLEAEGYEVHAAEDGVQALVLAADHDFGFAVLDIGMPGMSGFELCRRLRDRNPLLAILMLTARMGVEDRVRGLDAGADDYLAKPFDFAELAARLRALARRDALVATTDITVGDLAISRLDRSATVRGTAVVLSPREFDVLVTLAARAGEVLGRSELVAAVWGTTDNLDPNVLDQYVSYLRRKLAGAASAVTIVTERGLGYGLRTQ